MRRAQVQGGQEQQARHREEEHQGVRSRWGGLLNSQVHKGRPSKHIRAVSELAWAKQHAKQRLQVARSHCSWGYEEGASQEARLTVRGPIPTSVLRPKQRASTHRPTACSCIHI